MFSMMVPIRLLVCRAEGADRVVPKVPIRVVPRGHRRLGAPPRAHGSPRASGTVAGMRLGQPPGSRPEEPVRCAPMASAAPGLDRPIDVIIADDHTVVRDGIRAVLERENGEFRVVAEAADVPATIRAVREFKPDLLSLDLTMPGGSSLAALPTCFVAHPSLAVAILTMREDPEYARQALRAGARSYVLKEAEPAELLQAFRLAVAGQNYLHPRLGALMVAGDGAQQEGVALSEREREVVRLIANGYTNPEIAEQLHVAERTVKTYRARAIEKLGFSSRAEITAYARKLGLVE